MLSNIIQKIIGEVVVAALVQRRQWSQEFLCLCKEIQKTLFVILGH